jgi:hypothetical protein
VPAFATTEKYWWSRLVVVCAVILGLLPVVSIGSLAGAAAEAQPHKGQFMALTPARVFNTSSGLGVSGGAGVIGAAATKNVDVLGVGGVPATGVSAVVFSLTVVAPSAATTETVWPAGDARPAVASLTAPSKVTVTSTVTSAVGSNGQVSVYNSAGTANLYGDIVGYYIDAASTTAGSTYTSNAKPRPRHGCRSRTHGKDCIQRNP